MDLLPLKTPPTPLSGEKLSGAKFAGLDAIRGFAALGVVFFHACVPYLRNPMPGLTWAVEDASSGVVDFAFWWTELFIMPLFLVMAGFFAWKTVQNRGPRELVGSRAKRLLKPLLFGILVVLPLDLYCWVLGWVADGIVPAIKLRSLKFDPQLDQQLWGLSHLWFLQYLFLYIVVVAGVMKARSRFATLQRVRLGPKTTLSLIVLLGTATLSFHPEVVWGFQHAFAPVPAKWIYSGLSFALGLALAAHDEELSWIRIHANRLIAPAAVCSVAAVLLGQWRLSGGENQQAQLILAGLTSVSSILITLSIIGIGVSRIKQVHSSVSYLAAASFWIYIVHHPILGLVHIDLKFLMPGASPLFKTLIALTVTTGVCLLTYEGFVRKSWLGRWLGFAWEMPRSIDSMETPSIRFPVKRKIPQTPSRRAA